MLAVSEDPDLGSKFHILLNVHNLTGTVNQVQTQSDIQYKQ